MFFKLKLAGVEKIKFFDAIMYYLAENYSKKVNLEELKSKINYNDSRIKSLAGLDSFFEKDNIPQTYQKSLNLLLDLEYIVQDIQQYSLTATGLLVVTSGGLLGKETREINKYNYQNRIWVIIFLTFLTNVLFQVYSFSKLSGLSQTCSQCTKIETNNNKYPLQLKKEHKLHK